MSEILNFCIVFAICERRCFFYFLLFPFLWWRFTWSGWEGGTSKLLFDPALFANFSADKLADSIARIECHYFIHNAFFNTDNWILEHINRIRHIPCVIIQGRYDVPCPIESAWELHKAWPEAKLEIIPEAGHAATEPGIAEALIRATDHFSTL